MRIVIGSDILVNISVVVNSMMVVVLRMVSSIWCLCVFVRKVVVYSMFSSMMSVLMLFIVSRLMMNSIEMVVSMVIGWWCLLRVRVYVGSVSVRVY